MKKIPSYKFLPLMYQLAARMGIKVSNPVTSEDVGFHTVLNQVPCQKSALLIRYFVENVAKFLQVMCVFNRPRHHASAVMYLFIFLLFIHVSFWQALGGSNVVMFKRICV